MKKTILTIIAAISVMSAWAIEDAAMTVTLQSTNARYNVVSLEQGALYTNEKNTTDIYANITNTTTAVNIYAIAPYGNMSIMTTNNLDGVYLGITTNSCTDDYTLTFTGVSGAQLFLVDHETNETKPIVENLVHTFDATALSTIEDRFQIVNLVSLTTGQDGWASFAYSADLVPALPAGLTIYKGDFNGDLTNPAITLDPVADIPAGAGVFVKGDANTTYYFAATTASADMTGNDIYGCVVAKPVSEFAANTAIYTLRYANGETALYQYTGTADIPAGKAVLPIAGGSSAPKRVRMVINGTTAVENVEAPAKAEKFFEDGQVLIKRGDAVYNLQGQMVR